jgi:hypothetical protein
MRTIARDAPSILLADVIVLVDSLVARLSTFDGQPATRESLRSLFMEDAVIFNDAPDLPPRDRMPASRDLWLDRLTVAAVAAGPTGERTFFEEVARRSRGSSEQWLINSVIAERIRRNGKVVHGETKRWAMIVRPARGLARIAHLRMGPSIAQCADTAAEAPAAASR